MAAVDFITDEGFRESLLADMRELNVSIEQGNLKSAHVLAGSVVEAVLIDHLITAALVDSEKALRLELAEAIRLCKDNKIISERTADMSSVVRSYRNLIHPGRVLRLRETISVETANVARSLVHIVLTEVAAVRKESFGLTAEQIVTKLVRDPNVEILLPHLLKEAKEHQLKRLLTLLLPATREKLVSEEYFSLDHLRSATQACFRGAFGLVGESTKKEVSARFAALIRSEAGSVIDEYGEMFFRANDLVFLSDYDKTLVKGYLFGRMKSGLNRKTLDMLSGITAHLGPDDATRFIDPFARAVTRSRVEIPLEQAEHFLSGESLVSTGQFDQAVIKRLASWKEAEAKNADEKGVAAIDRLIAAFDPFPF